MEINKRTFYHLSLFTLYGFGLIGFLIIEFGLEDPFPAIFFGPVSWYLQLALGLVYGTISAIIAIFMVKLPFFKKPLRSFKNLASQLDLNTNDIFFFSTCAAIGEEILFRAALQPLIGVWPAAIIFVALHGYLNPKDWRISVYGVYMVIVAAGFGYLYIHAGIFAAFAAHFIIDVILFRHLKNEADKDTQNHS